MWEWFERYWSSVGLGAAIVMIALLLCTNVFRGRIEVSRWRDPVWLAWLMTVAYLLHNFEEYGIDVLGRAFHFSVTACQTYGFGAAESCPLTPSFFVAVNIPFVWVVLPAAALLARRIPAIGLTGAGLLLTNALSHIAGLATPMGYSPGTLTAAVLFVPVSLWVFATHFGRGKTRYQTMVAILLASLLAQAVLLGLLLGLSKGTIALPLAIAIQSIDPVLLLILPWVANRIWPPIPIRAVPVQTAA